jgi:hypothetical protein
MHEELIAERLPHCEAQIRSGEYPHIEALFGESSALEVWWMIVDTMSAESRFEKGLALLLDGIEARVAAA